MIQDLFREFSEIGYKGPGDYPKGIRDIKVSPLVIVRIGNGLAKVLYLYNGSSLSIPWYWIDLFTCLNVWGGHRISQVSPENVIDRFILDFSTLSNSIDCSVPDSDFLERLCGICTIGTKTFRDWCKEEGLEEIQKNLRPFEFTAIDKNLEI